MRYFLLSVALLAERESKPPVPRRLVVADGLGSLLSTGGPATFPTAVPIAAIASTAQKEDLSAATAGYEAQRVHGPDPGPKNWTRCRARATD